MKKFLWVLVCTIGINGFMGLGHAANFSADEIIKKYDQNKSVDSISNSAKMVIHQSGREDVKLIRQFGEGEKKSYILFDSPIRDKGTALLRLEDNIWMYLPSAEKIIKISGHMLRQSFMGSDMSYEDNTDRSKLASKYDIRLLGKDKIKDVDVYVLELNAKVKDASYYRRKMWIDCTNFVEMQQEMYSKSGKLLKVITVSEVQCYDNHYFITKFRMEDRLRKKTYTELTLSDVKVNQPIPQEYFSLKNLDKTK